MLLVTLWQLLRNWGFLVAEFQIHLDLTEREIGFAFDWEGWLYTLVHTLAAMIFMTIVSAAKSLIWPILIPAIVRPWLPKSITGQ